MQDLYQRTKEKVIDFFYEEPEAPGEERKPSRKRVFLFLFLILLLGILFGSLFGGGEPPDELDNEIIQSLDEKSQDRDRSEDRGYTFVGKGLTKDTGTSSEDDETTTATGDSGSGGTIIYYPPPSNNNGNNNNNNPTPTNTPNPTPTNTPNPTPTNSPTPPPNPSGTPDPTPTPSPTPFPGYVIVGLKPELDAVTNEPTWDQDIAIAGQMGLTDTRLETASANRVIARFSINFDSDKNWSLVNGDSIGTKAFFHYPGGYGSVPGAVGTAYTLYVPRYTGTQVAVCPGAATLEDVNKDCANIQYLDETSPDVDLVQIDSVVYWSITGVTGTGAFSLINTKDTLTRLEVNTASNHTIQFTTTYAIDSSGDTITVDFVPNQGTTDGSADFDFNGIGVDDIDLEDDSVDKTLAASAAAGVWGVSINSTTDIITFTAPTDAGATEIEAGSAIVIKIGTNADTPSAGNTQIINPDNVGLYELDIRLNNGSDVDFAELEIPIIDDDTANVTGFIDTFITFDIDTSEVDEDCDAAGGASPCDSHGGVSDNAGYVVDLGEMNTSSVSDSGDTVMHSDGVSGEVNSIYFDLSTNADNGAIVTVKSLNGALSGPGANSIPAVSDGSEQQIGTGAGLYGINSFSGLVNTATSGSAVVHDDCDGDTGNDYYCDTSTSAIEIFNTNSAPIDTLRLEWEIGVSPDSLDGTGTYTDELTFIATATF